MILPFNDSGILVEADIRSIEHRLGAIMTKLGFKKERKGHESRRGYWVREHLQPEIDQMRSPEVF